MNKLLNLLLAIATAASLASASPFQSRADSENPDKSFTVFIDYYCDQECFDKSQQYVTITQQASKDKAMVGTSGTPKVNDYYTVGEIKFQSPDDGEHQFYADRGARDETEENELKKEMHWNVS
jgi:hypothetical protein